MRIRVLIRATPHDNVCQASQIGQGSGHPMTAMSVAVSRDRRNAPDLLKRSVRHGSCIRPVPSGSLPAEFYLSCGLQFA